MTEWLSQNWPMLAVVGSTWAAWWLRERSMARKDALFAARFARLERAMIGLVYAHDDAAAHEAFVREERRNRPAAPVDLMPQAREEAETFRESALR